MRSSQTAAFNAWNRADQIRDEKGNLGDWFYTIAYHAAIDELRRQPDAQDRPCAKPGMPGGSRPETPEIQQHLLAEIETLVRDW